MPLRKLVERPDPMPGASLYLVLLFAVAQAGCLDGVQRAQIEGTERPASDADSSDGARQDGSTGDGDPTVMRPDSGSPGDSASTGGDPWQPEGDSTWTGGDPWQPGDSTWTGGDSSQPGGDNVPPGDDSPAAGDADVDLTIPDWMIEGPEELKSHRTDVAVTMIGLSSDAEKGGDAFLIQDDQIMLIDTGYSSVPNTPLTVQLAARGIHRIDYVLITHAHGDHYGGLWDVLASFDVGTVFAGDTGESSAYASLLSGLGSDWVVPSTGLEVQLGKSVMQFVFCPSAGFSSSINDRSIITKLIVGQASMLFTGDCGVSEGDYLAQHHAAALRCDVLKFPHHAQLPHAGINMLSLTDPDLVLVPISEVFWRWGQGHSDGSLNWYSVEADNFMTGRNPVFNTAEILFSDASVRNGRFATMAPVSNLLLRR